MIYALGLLAILGLFYLFLWSLARAAGKRRPTQPIKYPEWHGIDTCPHCERVDRIRRAQLIEANTPIFYALLDERPGVARTLRAVR